jgi:signal transduction histidine kinase
MNYRKGTQSFQPRARLVSVLGEQLIRDASVGLLELVKNGYDADADTVTVKLLKLKRDPFKSEDSALRDITIVVEDDGIGMSLETVLSKWMEPATGHKEEAKKKKEKSSKGRLPLGEKGVGRFAVQKIGHKLTLISRSKNNDGLLSDVEVVVNIDWDDFDNPEAYLRDIAIKYEEREPAHFINKSGTILIMEHARSIWKESDVKQISQMLRRLMSPFRGPKDFHVIFSCPDYPKYENLDSGEILTTAHAVLTFLVDDLGEATYDYSFNLGPDIKRKQEPINVDLRLGIEEWKPANRKPDCGGFFVSFYLWDRDPNSLTLSKTSKDDLDQYIGVSVFRDGIRVLPYGEPEDDWLQIDKARYLRTSEAFSRKNIIGAVEINQLENSNLRDKSNREGFIENAPFHDFLDLMTAVLNIAYNEFSDDRRKVREKEKGHRKELLPAVNQLEKSAKNARIALEETNNLADTFVKEGKIPTEVAIQIKANLAQNFQTVTGAIEDTRQAAVDTVNTFDEKQEMLLSLAGLGLAAEKFTHEFARLTRESTLITREIGGSAEIRGLVNIKNRVDALSVVLDTLHDLVIVLGPMFYIRRKTVEQDLDVKTMIDHALLLNRSEIKTNKIKVQIDEPDGKLSVRMRRSSLIQAINNLVDNSCYWLSRKTEEDNRHLKITIKTKEGEIIIADDGPGIHPKDRHRIFDPFFTNKVTGRGLGLFITREVLTEAQSIIELVEPGELPESYQVGACFIIKLSKDRIVGGNQNGT